MEKTQGDSKFSPVVESIRFECLKCGLCCGYRVDVSCGDVERLEGVSRDRNDFLEEETSSGMFRLKKKEEACVFLGKSSLCSVYPQRPEYCRRYPFFAEAGGQIDADLSCPGVGRGCEPDESFFEKVFPVTGTLNPAGTADFAVGLLKQRGSFATREEFREMEISPRPGEDLIPPEFFDIRNGANVYIGSSGTPEKYAFEKLAGNVIIQGKLFPEDPEPALIPEEGRRILGEYKKIWMGRELFYRFTLLNSLALLPGADMLEFRDSFIAGLFESVARFAAVLVLYRKEEPLTAIIRESIRAFDGRLRTKCAYSSAYCITSSN